MPATDVARTRRDSATLPARLLLPLLVVLLAFSPLAPQAAAQNTSAAYQQTVLSIQQQIGANRLDDARAAVAAAASKYPNDGGLENLLGVIEIEQGHAEEAQKDFRAAIGHDPHLAGAYMNLSRIDMQTAASDEAARAEALAMSEMAIRLNPANDPANDEANYQIATILSWQKSYRRSLVSLDKLSAQARKQVGAEALRCTDEAALAQREAATQAAAALASNPDLTEQDADTCLPALRLARRADLIESLFAAANAHQPLSAAGLRTLGLAQEAEGKLADSRATLERAFAADSTSEIVLVDLARVAREAKDLQGALGYLAHARDLKPSDASLPYEFGAICLEMGLYGESRKALEDAVKLAPDDPQYNLGLGTVISYSDDPSQALPYLTKYHTLRPSDPAGFLALGAAYFRAKDYDNAVTWLKQAAGDAKSAPDAYFYLGRIAREEGRPEEAVDDLKQSLAARADQPDVLAELGQICIAQKNYAQASSYLDRAVHLDRDNYAANFGLLELYARTGDPRRSDQAKRFDEVKDKREQWDRNTMRILEIRRDAGADATQ
jgi:tetratricopeptide (TPR) repeat protein